MYVYKLWADTNESHDYWRFIERDALITEIEERKIRENFRKELIAAHGCTITLDGLTLYTIELK